MNEPLQHYMRIGIVHFMAYPACMGGEGPVLDSLQPLIDDPFFSVVELAPVKDPSVRQQAMARLTAARMTVGLAAQPVVLANKLNPNALDEGERSRAVQTLKDTIDQAAEMGIKRVAMLSGRDPGAADREAALAQLCRSLTELSQHAAVHGIELVLEVFDQAVDKCALVGPAETARAVAQAVRPACPNFGLMVDLSHIPLLGESPRQALVPVKDYLMHVHIGNCAFRDRSHPAWGDNHPRFGVPGGENDVPELADFLETLFEIGYLGAGRAELPIVSFEVKPMPGEDGSLVIANAKRTLLEAWRLVNA